MACLTENQIVEFFSVSGESGTPASVEEHLSGCELCRDLLAEYAQLGASTSATHVDFGRGDTLGTLTPTIASRHERVELVQRFAKAQARKYVGKVLKGKWEIEELIGTGGMAHVFAARHRNGRRVAIKCMRPELMLERSLVERFLREGYVANKIAHPGAVAILDDDVMDDGTPFLVMELLVGRTLRQRLDAGPLALGEALRAIAEVLDLLAVAHDKGIVHRDLKPDNLFETEEGAIKVLDFGIARLKERARPDLETRSGLTMGTLGYMAPEQARGLAAQVDARSDVWAIGATLYSLISGRRIHDEAATTNEGLLLAMTSHVPPMSALLPSLPVNVQALLDTSLAFDRERRFPSARAMKEALDPCLLGVEDTVAASSLAPSSPPDGPTVAPARATSTMLDRAFARRGAADARPRLRATRWWVGGVGAAALALASGLLLQNAVGGSGHTPAQGVDPSFSVQPSLVVPPPTEQSSTSASAAPSGALVAPEAIGMSDTDSGASSAPATTAPAAAKPSARPSRSTRPPIVVVPTHSPSPTDPAPVDTRDPLGPQH